MIKWLVRTTIDLPDALFRRTKATAAIRGLSMKDLIAGAIEREVNADRVPNAGPMRVALPLMHLRTRRKLDLSKFNFDDLLA